MFKRQIILLKLILCDFFNFSEKVIFEKFECDVLDHLPEDLRGNHY